MQTTITNVNHFIEQSKVDVTFGGGIYLDPKNKDFGVTFDSVMIAERYGLMPVNDLSVFEGVDEIEEKLFKFMQNEGIELNIIPDDRSEMFVCTRKGYKAIFLCPKDIKNKNKDRLLGWVHEIGHYMDLKYGFDFDVAEFQLSASTEEGLVKAEVIAWAYAKFILEALGFEDWYAYTLETVKALNTYIYGGTEQTAKHLKKTGEYLASRVQTLHKIKGD